MWGRGVEWVQIAQTSARTQVFSSKIKSPKKTVVKKAIDAFLPLLFFRHVRFLHRLIGNDPAVPARVFEDQRYGERPCFHPGNIREECSRVLPLYLRAPCK